MRDPITPGNVQGALDTMRLKETAKIVRNSCAETRLHARFPMSADDVYAPTAPLSALL